MGETPEEETGRGGEPRGSAIAGADLFFDFRQAPVSG